MSPMRKVIDELNPTEVVISVICLQCGEQQPEFNLTHGQLLAWRNGVKIQHVLPNESPGRRELLISGTCEPCFDKMFAE